MSLSQKLSCLIPRVQSSTVTVIHRVARLEAPPLELQNAISRFVADCRTARLTSALGSKPAVQEANVLVAEASFPELTTSYNVGPQAGRRVDRKHGQVWHALVATLNRLNIPHSNNRVGRWGPDLRTIADPPVLFEIKVTNQASDLQRIGQLFLYEKLLKVSHRKVLVLPNNIEGGIRTATQQLAKCQCTHLHNRQGHSLQPVLGSRPYKYLGIDVGSANRTGQTRNGRTSARPIGALPLR
jgi:hypothetical protein